MREFFPLPDTMTTLLPAPGGGLETASARLPEARAGELVFRLEAAAFLPEILRPAEPGEGRGPVALVGEIAAAGDGVGGWEALDRAVLALTPAERLQVAQSGIGEFFTVSGERSRGPGMRKLPLEMRADTACLLPAAARASRILRAAAVPEGGAVLVTGLDLVGLATVILTRHQHTRWIVAADPSPTRRRRAEWGGAARLVAIPGESEARAVRETFQGRGLNAAVVLGSGTREVGEALSVLAPGGTLVVGSPEGPAIPLGIDLPRLAAAELTVRGIAEPGPRDLRDGFRQLRQGLLDPDVLVSRRVAWPEAGALAPDPEFPRHGLLLVVEGADPEGS